MELFDFARKHQLLTKSRNTSSSFKNRTETIDNQKEIQMKVSTSYLKNIFIQKTEPSDKQFPQIKSNPNFRQKTRRDSSHYDYPLITKPEIADNPSEKDKSTLFSIQTKNQSDRESIMNNPQDIKDQLITQLNSKLNQSARTIKQLTSTNNNQKKALEKLSSELDTYINNASKQIIKNSNLIVKDTPVDIVIKVKEKELKNAMTLIDILTKDNNNLQMLLNKTSLQEHHNNLLDQLKEKDRMIQNILNDNKLFKKQIDDYRIEMREKKEQDEIVSRVQQNLLMSIEDNTKFKNKISEKLKDRADISPEWNSRINIYSPNDLDKYGTNKRNKKIKLVMLSDKNKQETHSFISDSKKCNQTSSVPKKIDKLNCNIEKDNLLKKIQELNEKNEYLNGIIKETEQTIKHLQCQVNEYKIEANIYKRKYKETLEREAVLKKQTNDGDTTSSNIQNNKLIKTQTTGQNVESISSSNKITESFKMVTNE